MASTKRLTNDERKAMNLWWQLVFAEGGDKCAMTGSHEPCAGPPVAHHIAGRGNGRTFNPDLGQQLCTHHHMEAQFAPHNNKRLYLSWLELNWPEKYQLYMELKDKVVKKRDIDMKQVVADLERRLDKAMCMVA